MSTPKLPNTQARLSISITIRVIKSDQLGAQILNNPTALAQLALQATPIGAIEELTEVNNRRADHRYQMDAANPGVVVETYPSHVAERTVSINRAVLYESDMLQAFGIDNDDLLFQNAPFAIVKIETVPNSSGLPERITIYRDCWFTDNPKSYAIARDLKIIQSMTARYSNKDVINVPPAA